MTGEFLIHINPTDNDRAGSIIANLRGRRIIKKGDEVMIGVDSSIASTRPPTVRVEQVFRIDAGTVDTVRVTS